MNPFIVGPVVMDFGGQDTDLAKAIILESRGVHFDPDIVDAFLEAETEFMNIQQCFADHGSHHEAGAPGTFAQSMLGEGVGARAVLRR